MSDRILVGDSTHLETTFYSGTTATDPSTVTLAVTDPSGNVTTYTYAASQVTKSSTGVYYRNVTVDEDGVWEFNWTATGAVADAASGTFTVWPATVDDIDVLDLIEAKDALDIDQEDTDRDAKLRGWITAVSALLDENCGPIRTRVETNTAWTSHPLSVGFVGPIHSVGTLNSYEGDVATLLAESTTNGYRLTPRVTGTGNYTGTITRVGGVWGDRVVLNGTFGRYPSTEVVHPRFKQAAVLIMKNLFRSEDISVGNVDGFDVPYSTFPASFAIPNSVRDLLGDDWNGQKDRTMSAVMFG